MSFLIFKHPEYFVSIVENKSLTRAAEKLYVSQPYLSQYLKRLEQNLGVELFDHSTSPLRLTYIGEQYYHYVIQILQLSDQVRKEFVDAQNNESGRLRLGTALWRGSCLLPDVYPSFHKKYPKIQLELLEAKSSDLENALLTDKIDLAIMNLNPTFPYHKLACEILFEEQILLAVPSKSVYKQELLKNATYSHPFPCVPKELLSQIPLILTKPGQSFTQVINFALAKNNITPNILLETANLTTSINLAATGFACTFVPEEGARAHNYNGNITYFSIDIPELSQSIAAVYPKKAKPTRLAQLFIQMTKDIFCQKTLQT